MNILTKNGTEAQISSSLQTSSSRQTITPPTTPPPGERAFWPLSWCPRGLRATPCPCTGVLGGDPLPTATVDVLHYSLSPKPLSSHLRFVLSGVQDVSTWKSLPGEPFAVSRNWVTLGGSWQQSARPGGQSLRDTENKRGMASHSAGGSFEILSVPFRGDVRLHLSISKAWLSPSTPCP